MSGPLLVGLVGSTIVAFCALALWMILRPARPDATPPSDDSSLNWYKDPKVDSLFRELWRFVVVMTLGAGAQLAALVWQLSGT